MNQDHEPVRRMLAAASSPSVATLDVGSKVCVRNRFLGDWTTGFEVAEVHLSGFRIRRLSDGQDFPDIFPAEDVRVERRTHPQRGTIGSYRDRRTSPGDQSESPNSTIGP